MEVEGDCSLWHHFIFCEELHNNDEENFIVCCLCLKPLWGGPTYKCLECNFRQHESCREDNIESDGHDFEERHHLIFIEELLDKYNGGMEEVVCPGCQEPGFGPAYKCSFPKCTFFLHKSCSEQLSLVIQHPVHPEHALFLQLPSINCCDVCRKYCYDSLFYRCFTCDFDIDIKCESRWRISAEDCHQHSLFRMRKQMQFTCEACAEESNDIAYQCNDCRVLIHDECAKFSRTIKTSTHDHSLTRTYSLCQVKKQETVLCLLCRKKVNTKYAAYYCRKCDYIAHMKCANYFQVEDGDRSETTDEVDANQLVHLVEGIELTEDERASPREIDHFSHPQHNLILINEELVDVKRCEACIQFIIATPFYGCAQCNIFLHYRCTKLPLTIKRGLFHEHPLTLLSQDVNSNELFGCNSCGRGHDGFVYRCDECEDEFDVQCCLIPGILEHKGHEHSLYLVIRSSSEICNGCGIEGVNFRCTHCDEFTLCFRCATLPLVARYKYHTHLLKLSYTREDDSDEEYYCLICEEERDHPNHWFYSCVKCKFTAHSRCILGENPCIRINDGRTFTSKDDKRLLTLSKIRISLQVMRQARLFVNDCRMHSMEI
jgi:hypothetical protein